MSFKHFPRETADFFLNLKQNNNKEWFELNRKRYNDFVLKPAFGFVEEMGSLLKNIEPDIQAIPKIDKSVFRLFRDARFHKGKAPFKTHLGIVFWKGASRLEVPSFYFHFEPPFYMTGVGMAMFTPKILAEYRNSIVHQKHGKEFLDIANILLKEGFEIGGTKRKNLPRGFSSFGGDVAEYLLYDNIFFSDEMPLNEDFYQDSFLEYTFNRYKLAYPYYKWLSGVIERSNTI